VTCVRGVSWISAGRSSLREAIVLKTSVLCFLATWLSPAFVLPALRAEELAVDLDPAKTKVAFVLSDVLHTVRGTFHMKDGHVAFDPSGRAITGDVIVDATSGNSGSGTRDKRMTRDILETGQYPEIRFQPHKIGGTVSPSSPSNIEVTGSFLIHGQAHEITIPMQIQTSQAEITATGKFIVPYVLWGMKNPSNFLVKVSDKVEIDFVAVGYVNGTHVTGK
jgi:polyisoprenoid-binding protein YceI